MTSTVNMLTQRFLDVANYEAIARHVDAIFVGLVLLLLAERELIRAYLGPDAARERIRPLWVLLAPLAPAFLFIVVVRSARLR